MGLDALKQQLASGTITKEEFAVAVGELLKAGTITQEEFDDATKEDSSGGQGGGNQAFDIKSLFENPAFSSELQKLVQSETDKVRTAYAQKVKDKEKELEDLKLEKMNEEDKAKYLLDQKERELEDKTKALNQREVALHTVDKLTASSLPLSFKSILAGSTIEETDERIKTFETEWNNALAEAVKERFKEKGGKPGTGKEDPGERNPWKKETYNLTEQMRITREDPEKAKRLEAAAK